MKEYILGLLERDWVERAAWTFVQAFLAVVLVADAPLSVELIAGGVGAGLSALKTLVLVWLRERKA